MARQRFDLSGLDLETANDKHKTLAIKLHLFIERTASSLTKFTSGAVEQLSISQTSFFGHNVNGNTHPCFATSGEYALDWANIGVIATPANRDVVGSGH